MLLLSTKINYKNEWTDKRVVCKIVFYITFKVIFWYSKEPSHREDSFEHQKCLSENIIVNLRIIIPRGSRRNIVLASSVRPSVHTFCLSGTISQYLLVRFDSFLVQMISTMDSLYPISLVKIDPLTLELLPLFSICNYKAKPILTFFV